MSIALFILILFVGFFAGSTTILALAHLLDSRNEREVMRRALLVTEYAEENDVDFKMAYSVLRKMNFVY